MAAALGQQKDLFTRKWRKVKRFEPSELQLQILLIEHLKVRCRPGVVYYHCPNGEERNKRTAAKLKAMGVLPGVADLIFIWLHHTISIPMVLFLELKARGRKPTETQLLFAAAVKEAGCHWEWADNIDEALRILKDDFGLIK